MGIRSSGLILVFVQLAVPTGLANNLDEALAAAE